MNEYELARLKNLVHDWNAREYHDKHERHAFMMGIRLTIMVLDGMTSAEENRIMSEVQQILIEA